MSGSPQITSSMQLWSGCLWCITVVPSSLILNMTACFVCVCVCVNDSDGKRGAAGEAAEGMAGLLRDRRRHVGCHAEELPPPQPPPGHPDGGEVVGQIPPDPPLCLSVWRWGRGGRRRVSEGRYRWKRALYKDWTLWALGEYLTIYIFFFSFLQNVILNL